MSLDANDSGQRLFHQMSFSTCPTRSPGDLRVNPYESAFFHRRHVLANILLLGLMSTFLSSHPLQSMRVKVYAFFYKPVISNGIFFVAVYEINNSIGDRVSVDFFEWVSVWGDSLGNDQVFINRLTKVRTWISNYIVRAGLSITPRCFT